MLTWEGSWPNSLVRRPPWLQACSVKNKKTNTTFTMSFIFDQSVQSTLCSLYRRPRKNLEANICYIFFPFQIRKCWVPWINHQVIQRLYGSSTLQMFCLLKSQMNACEREQSPKTTSSDFNRWKSVTKIFCFHAISTAICLLF